MTIRTFVRPYIRTGCEVPGRILGLTDGLCVHTHVRTRHF
jgi:hypothetical protein